MYAQLKAFKINIVLTTGHNEFMDSKRFGNNTVLTLVHSVSRRKAEDVHSKST